LKAHGSIDWYRYYLERDGWSGRFTARAAIGDPFHSPGPDRELLEFPAGGGPQILTRTFSKILSYPTGVYAEQHFRLHQVLVSAGRSANFDSSSLPLTLGVRCEFLGGPLEAVRRNADAFSNGSTI
jgi:hypothetical protein